MRVRRIDNDEIGIRGENEDTGGYYVSNKNALQLVKDLLDACGVVTVCFECNDSGRINEKVYPGGAIGFDMCPCKMKKPDPSSQTASQATQRESDVSSGMSLDEIQTEAGKIWENKYNTTDVLFLAMLTANLAARMKEQNDHPKPGSKFTCPCGLQYIYGKRV